MNRPPIHAGERWSPAEDSLLGSASDRDVAEALARPLKAVRLKRQRLGIPAFKPGRGPK